MKKTLISFAFMLLALMAAARGNYIFRPLTANDVMTDNYIHSVMRDHNGFMWVVSSDGIHRYDGFEYKFYTAPGGRYEKYFLREDAKKILWIRTGENTFIYDRENDSISADINRHLDEPSDEKPPKVYCVDHDGNLWYGKSGKLVYLERVSGKKTLFSSINSDDILSLECRGDKAYILNADGTLKRIDLKKKTCSDVITVALSNHMHHMLYLDFSDTLWIFSPHSSMDVLRYFDESRKEIQVFTDNNKNAINFVTAVLDDGRGNIWIGTDNAGILVYSKKDPYFVHIKYDSQNLFSIPSDHINCFFLDTQDCMWVGTTKHGVAFTSLDEMEIERHTLSNSDDINSIMEDKDGNLWFGTDGNGIFQISTGHAMNVDFPAKLVTCSCVEPNGRIWFGTYGSGVFYREGDHFMPMNYVVDGVDRMKGVRCITADTFGNIWVGTVMDGLYCIDRHGTVTPYVADDVALRSNSITSLHCRNSQILYVMTADGPAVVDTYTRKISPLSDNDALADELNIFSTFIYKDSRGFIWLGGEKHLGVYLPKSHRFINLSDRFRIHNEYVKAITEDDNRNIWVSTNAGLSNLFVAINPSDNEPIIRRKDYTGLNGIEPITFNGQSICKRNDGEMIVGGIGGYVSFRPDEFVAEQSEHPVMFTSLLIDDTPVGIGEERNGKVILDRNIELLERITLDYALNSFSLYVSCMDYSDSHRKVMAYRLHDSEDWVELAGNKISFSKLAPGDYNLQVKVYDDNHENTGISSLKIRIRPPMWQSSGAYVLYGLILLTTVGGIIIYIRRKAQSKLKMHEMEMNFAKQKELEESQMQFFTNISHDLRTPLSLILLPLNKLMAANNLDVDTREQLNMMRRNAEILMTEVNQLLDLRKLDNGKATIQLTTGNLTEFVRDICSNFEPYSKNMAVDLHVILPDTPIILDFDRNKIQRILMNLLSNAYKFNRKNGTISVEVRQYLSGSQEMAQIIVADTGIGISKSGKDHIFERFFQETQKTDNIGNGIGLHIVKEYVSMHGGTIEVSDNQPYGTVFTISLPIDRTEEAAPLPKASDNKEPDKYSTDTLPILVVDDNDDFRQFIISCLKETYPMISASNGKEALAILESQPVSMVISDVMMPVMDGLELCNRIKSDIATSHIPVILLTAKAADEHVLNGLREGADEYITKPFNLDILMLRIARLLENKEKSIQKFKTVVEVKPSEITISTLDEQIIERAIAIVESNIDKSDFSVEQLGEQLGLSRSHLYRKLMAITGMTPLEFIHSIRVKRGKQLLEQGQLPVSEVAFMVGLSPKQFSKYFKDTFGVLPSAFKRNL